MTPVLVSACLLGSKVRYNATCVSAECEHMQWLRSHCHIMPLCPEVAAGLPIPRAAAEIVGGDGDDVLAGRARIVTADGEDVTAVFLQGARQALALCKQHDIRYAVLTESSASCGSNTIYNGEFGARKVPGQGVVSALLRANHVSVFSQHTLKQLRVQLSD